MVYGNCYLLSVICYLYSKKNRFWKLSTVTLGDDVIDLSCDILLLYSKRIRDAAFFLIIMLVTFAATLLNPQKYVSSRTIQKCVEHVSTST